MISFTPVFRLLTLSTVALLGATPGALAAGAAPGAPDTLRSHAHQTQPPHVRPGHAGSFVQAYKLDGELSRRATSHPLQTSSVIVTLVPGAVVPARFKKFVHGDKLDIINGQVLELPNNVLADL